MDEIRTIPRFHLLASRRFMLDNEIVLSEFVPGTVACPSLQNGAMPYCPAPPDAAAEGTFFVGGFFPGIHFSADVRSLSPGAAALLDIAPPDGSILFRVRAEPGKPVSFAETRGAANLACALANPQVVPPPPFRLSAVVAGPTVLLAARKDGDVRFLGSVTLDEAPENDIRRRDFAGVLKCAAIDHLFRDSDGSWKGVAIGWSTTAHNLDPATRKGSGLVVVETRECPLHGIHVLPARPLVVGDGVKSEDPHLHYDAEAGKWRLSTSSFTPQGLRAHLWESDRWDGPYTHLAGPGRFDSTGCQIMEFGGRKFVMTANLERMRPVYAYPALAYVGEWPCDMEPSDGDCPNGRVFTAWAETPAGCPWRYVMLTMDRRNFPGMPDPNWTYGGIRFYVA